MTVEAYCKEDEVKLGTVANLGFTGHTSLPKLLNGKLVLTGSLLVGQAVVDGVHMSRMNWNLQI